MVFYTKIGKKSAIGLSTVRFGRVFGPTLFERGTDGAVWRSRFVFLGVFLLFVLGIDKRAKAVLTSKNFIRHGFYDLLIVDLGGIEPPSWQCECHVLPLYYRPGRCILSIICSILLCHSHRVGGFAC